MGDKSQQLSEPSMLPSSSASRYVATLSIERRTDRFSSFTPHNTDFAAPNYSNLDEGLCQPSVSRYPGPKTPFGNNLRGILKRPTLSFDTLRSHLRGTGSIRAARGGNLFLFRTETKEQSRKRVRFADRPHSGRISVTKQHRSRLSGPSYAQDLSYLEKLDDYVAGWVKERRMIGDGEIREAQGKTKAREREERKARKRDESRARQVFMAAEMHSVEMPDFLADGGRWALALKKRYPPVDPGVMRRLGLESGEDGY